MEDKYQIKAKLKWCRNSSGMKQSQNVDQFHFRHRKCQWVWTEPICDLTPPCSRLPAEFGQIPDTQHWVTECHPYGYFVSIILILRIKTLKWHTNRPKYQHGPQRNSNKCSHQWKWKHPCLFEELLKLMNQLNINIWTTDCNSSIIIESSQQGETI